LDGRSDRPAPRMDRRLPRHEDGLAPDRRLMALPILGRPRVGRPQLAQRRIYINAPPRTVWLALHDPENAALLFPDLDLGPAEPTWPAAAALRRGESRLGLLRSDTIVESLEARPASSFRLRVQGDEFVATLSWRLIGAFGGTRVLHEATFQPTDRLAGWLAR